MTRILTIWLFWPAYAIVIAWALIVIGPARMLRRVARDA